MAIKGKWFDGDVYSMSSEEIRNSRKHEKGIKKPTAIETRTLSNGKVQSRYYYKPIEEEELD